MKVSSVETSNIEPNWKYQPGHPDAIKSGEREGYVAYPNIDLTTEFVDAIEATRAYEANIGVMEISKSIAQHYLRVAARKLGARNRVHAVAIAVRMGLIDPHGMPR